VRVAYLSPLPPQRSGIADYSAELLPELARHLEIELVADAGARPAAELAERFAVRRTEGLAELLERRHYDALLYHLGNEASYHGEIYRQALRHPGVIVLHEAMLHHLVRALTLARGDAAGFVEEMRYAYGGSGEAAARRAVATGVLVDPWSYPLFERAVDRSRGVVVHNRTGRDRVLASRPRAPVAVVPFPFTLPEPLPSPAAARQALGLAPDQVLVGCFGFVTPEKRPEVVMRAFGRLRADLPQARLAFVGELSQAYEGSSFVPADLRPTVTVTGRFGMSEFLSWMAAADLAVNLRYPSGGETSATLVRLLGLGKPVVVSAAGSFNEIPDGACARVDPVELEDETLAAVLRRLALDPPLRAALGENARRHAEREHSLAATARGYVAALEAAAAAGDPRWAVPPLAPYPPEDLRSALVAELAAAAVDLGVEEGDDEALAAIARPVVELDLDR
jgi:glycosyltransferase involved in cell wall biosynthesis